MIRRAPALLGAAGAAMVFIYLLPWPWSRFSFLPESQGAFAASTGILLALFLGVWFGRFPAQFRCPMDLDPQLGDVIKRRAEDLRARLDLAQSPWETTTHHTGDHSSQESLSEASKRAYREADRHLTYVSNVLGCSRPSLVSASAPDTSSVPNPSSWERGYGWIDLWERIHAAEEAMYMVLPREEVIGMAIIDKRRLTDSLVDNRDQLLRELAIGAYQLGDRLYLADLALTPKGEMGQSTPARVEEPIEIMARHVLAGVHHSIDYFRDRSRKGLVRTRRHLLLAGWVAGLLSIALLALILVIDIGQTHMVAATVFFLVGALVGVFKQLSNPAVKLDLDDDFGLGHAELVLTPLLSGLAAIGGVLLVALLLRSLDAGAGDVMATDGGADLPSLGDIFDLQRHQFGLVLSAIFGLTPSLLVTRLMSEAGRYRDALRSTTAESKGTA